MHVLNLPSLCIFADDIQTCHIALRKLVQKNTFRSSYFDENPF